jgi:hypothetical protein
MYTKVKCYGGPLHGTVKNLDKGVRRFEVAVRFSPDPYLANIYTQAAMAAEYLAPKPMETLSYFLQAWHQDAITVAGARVRRHLFVALLEGTEVLDRERRDLEWDMQTKMWEWLDKPNFLTQFDQWWEYQLNEVARRQPKIRHHV